jgi:RHS repeat-associated protein
VLERSFVPSAGCAANYECVDEATPDGDATYVTASTTGYADLYALPDLSQSAAVVSVTVTAVARGYPTGSCSFGFDCFGALKLRVNGYPGPLEGVSDSVYETVTETWTTNPATTLPWTVSEVNGLQAGVEKASFSGFSTLNTRVTQLYVTVQLAASYRTVAYDDVNNLVTATDEAGRVVRYTYDRANRLVKVEEQNPATGLYNATETKYDGTGSVVSVRDPEGRTTFHVYDDLGRLAVTLYPDTAKTYEKYTYDNADNLVSKRKRDGVTTAFLYNQLDRLTRITYPGNYLVDFTYDKIGNTKKVVNANATLWYEYDARNRMTKESSDTMVAGGTNDTTTYTYDAASNLGTMTYPDGTVLTYVVDAFNRVVSVKSGTTTYASLTYRSDDRISTASFGNAASTLYTYDVRSRPTRLQTSTVVMRPSAAGDTTQWTKSGSGGKNWDRVDDAMPDDDTYVKATAAGKIDKYNLQDYTLAVGETVTAVEVHAFARQTTAASNAGLKLRVNGAESPSVSLSTTYTEYAASWAVDPADGQAWTQTDINALQAGQTLGAISSGEARVTQVWVVLRTSKPLLDLQYAYNAAGDATQLVTTRSTSTWTETLAYDGQDRLRTWTASGSNAFSQAFTYTAGGDRSSMVEDTIPWSYVYTSDHRLWYYNKTGYTGQLTYDPNGNVVTRTITSGSTTTYSYAYDAEDRLTVATQLPSTTLGSYQYDGLGRRVKSVEGGTTTYFVYSGLSLIYTKVGTTVTKYVYASGLLVARLSTATPTVAYFHQDPLGSTRAVTDANRAIVFGTQYKPFGAEFGTTGTDSKLKFTGQHKDAATGLYYLFRRFYDPELGRFLVQDRILGHLTVPQSLVRYAYTVNNPLRYVDPTGEDWWNPLSWGADVASAVGAAADAVGDWWASSSIWDKLDMAMTIVGFIPGLDVVSDAYFLGRAIVDVIQGKGSWADVAMNAAFLLAPAVGGAVFRAAKTAANVLDGAGDAGRALNKVDNLADATKAVGKADQVGDAAEAAVKRLPDDAPVVRGGLNRPEDIARNLRETGGISALSAAGKSPEELAAFVPHRRYGATTVGEIRAMGGDVISTPRPGNPHHADILLGPMSPDQLSKLFQPTRLNPSRLR